MAVKSGVDHEEEETETRDETEKWIQHYSSLHQILLVGDGDFSFSLCLAKAFGSASNMVATSLDQYDVLIKNYQDAKSNLESLRKLGATIMHGVDATRMKLYPDLQRRKFDRVIYNFPHAGFHGKEDQVHMIKMHKDLIGGFFRNASHMLRPFGEVHINNKKAPLYESWNLEDLARKYNLALVERVEFKKEDYPGYKNKRGAGPRCNEPFPLGKCCTFKFVFKKSALEYIHTAPYQIQRTQPQVQNPPPFEPSHLSILPQNHMVRPHTDNPTPLKVYNPTWLQVQQMPSQPQDRVLFDVGYPLAKVNRPSNFRYLDSPYAPKVSDKCYWIFHEYFADTEKMYGQTGYHVGRVVHETLRTGFDRCMIEAKGRDLSGYIMHLEELHHYSVSRSEWLRRMLYHLDKQKMG
ncbi:heavy metal-associated isoprenylated plant protein 41-like isoform X1 [Papaver somniferum]|nr:heavy metal-associated isoprenylated plant protein 41-like isoform X1 [Papaver somniferum]